MCLIPGKMKQNELLKSFKTEESSNEFKLGFTMEKYGLIAELAYRLNNLELRFGKTALQKLVYLLQELYNVKVGYDFSLYTYGPFSSELLSDLDFVESLHGVEVGFIPEIHGYKIFPGKANESVRTKAKHFLETASVSINKIINDFGDFNAKELELRSTIIFVNRDLKRKGKSTQIQTYQSSSACH